MILSCTSCFAMTNIYKISKCLLTSSSSKKIHSSLPCLYLMGKNNIKCCIKRNSLCLASSNIFCVYSIGFTLGTTALKQVFAFYYRKCKIIFLWICQTEIYFLFTSELSLKYLTIENSLAETAYLTLHFLSRVSSYNLHYFN